MLDAYNHDLDEMSRDAVTELLDFLSDYDLDEMDLEARECLRDETIEELLRIIDDYGDASAALGADFYETVLDMADNDGAAAMPAGIDRKRVDRAVRRCASNLFGDDADIGKYADSISDFLERVVSHRADECVAQSAVAANEASSRKGKRKGKKLEKKFARVPSGPSCGFCIMLASRGFVYATKEAAGEFTRFHNKCDCRIVEGYDGMRVEGYDPDGLYKRYKSCRDTLRVDASPSPIRRDWDRLPADEKAKYYKPGDPKRKPSYDQYLAQRIADEMDTRDRQWLYDGKPLPKAKIETGAKPKKKELKTEEYMREAGFSLSFRKPTGKGRTSDVYIISGPLDSPISVQWEMKKSDGDPDTRTVGKKNIKNQFRSARGQSRNLIIDVSGILGFTDTEGRLVDREYVIAATESAIIHHEEAPFFDQAIIVFGEGDVVRIVKPTK